MFELIDAKDWHGLLWYIETRVAIILVLWTCLLAATMIDTYYGRKAAKAKGEKLQSKKYRRYFAKVGDYIRVMAFALMFDFIGSFMSWYGFPYMSLLYTIGAIAIEAKSVREKLSAIKSQAADVPDMVRAIIEASTKKDAMKIYNELLKK